MAIDFTAQIYELTEWKPRRKDLLKPFPGKFFRGPINTSTRVCELGELNGTVATLYEFFFQDTAARRVMVVLSRASAEPLLESEARGVLGQFVGPTQKEPVSRVFWARGSLEQNKQSASGFLRESGSLTENDFEHYGRLCVASDARGAAVIDTTVNALPPGERAERLAALCALAFAYRSVLDDVIDLLAVAGRNPRISPEQQLRAWSQFMSSYYFHEPIKLATIELARFYGAVRERHKISNLAQEVTDQLRLLAELVRLDRSEAQAKREKSMQRWIGCLGLMIAVFGATLTAAQVTPKVVSDAFSQWSQCNMKVGLLTCLNGGYKETASSDLQASPSKPVNQQKKMPTRH